MVKVMYNNTLVYNVYIWVLLGINFGKVKQAINIRLKSDFEY